MTNSSAATTYLAGTTVSQEQLQTWVETFHRQGFLFLQNVLPPDWCAELRADLDWALEHNPNGMNAHNPKLILAHRLFETSQANLRLFDVEPIVSFAEVLIAPNCHVIHNNSFKTPTSYGIDTWHQDDAPHYLVTEGEPPKNVRLPVLFFTANYYLTDVSEIENGGTEVIPGSHLFGAPCPPVMDGTKWESQIHYNCGGAGSVVFFTNQLWHRGGPNKSERTRYITQVTYARRIIGHKYYPFMNYQMPEHLYKDANPRLKRLLGFLPVGHTDKNMQQIEIWDLWYPKAGATGFSFARGRIAAGAEGVLVHAAPPLLTVVVRTDDEQLIAKGKDLQRTDDTPISRLTRRGTQIERIDIWPGPAELGQLVLLPGGEVGILKAWWHADDRSEWRWQIELYNHR